MFEQIACTIALTYEGMIKIWICWHELFQFGAHLTKSLRLMQIQTPQLGKKSPALGKYELVVYVILIETSY